ncbi:hypothetical protein [Paraburkholderia caffeinilytica]|uniref:hypothetical protein n=1 Tax=Paraburkholderia caffeinilytica TaxID=1761016 RepID=UPI0038B851D2
MSPDLFNHPPPAWLEQSELARKIAQARKKAEKHQLVSLLCTSLARMTEKPKHRRPL